MLIKHPVSTLKKRIFETHAFMFSIPVSYIAATAAVLAVVMWIDYYRRIDVFEPESYPSMLVALGIGACSPFLSLQVYKLIAALGFHETKDLGIDLLYAVFAVGLNEELCKLAAVLLCFFVLRKHLNDAVDYLIYAGLCALGFALVENFIYFENHGLNILSSRAFYSVLEHLINTTLIVYGMYRHKLFKRGKPFVNTAVALGLAVASHGLFDYFLGLPNFENLNAFISVLIYLTGINFWVQMLNNANNFSSYFNYQKLQASSRLVMRLFFWFVATVLFTFSFNALFEPGYALRTLLQSIFSDGFIFLLVILRVSRFSMIKQRYVRLRLVLPFYIVHKEFADIPFPFLNYGIKVRGESYREQALNSRVGLKITLYAAEDHNKQMSGIIEQKIALKNEQVGFLFAGAAEAGEKKKRFLLHVLAKPIDLDENEGVEVAAFRLADEEDAVSLLKTSPLRMRLSGTYFCKS